jgi:radical SAM superfamily enzyme with C-terminal helix-hairpin-helix motif
MWYCVPVIPPSWEAEAGGSWVQGQPGELKRDFQNNKKYLRKWSEEKLLVIPVNKS